MRLNEFTSPLERLRNSSLMVRTRSPRTVQQRQPEFSVTMPSSVDFSTRRWSSPISPNSLMITAVSASSGRRRSLFRSVVLPLPRKPVSTVTGMRSSAAVCVLVISTPFWTALVPEPLGLPERLPRPLKLVPSAFVAGCGLLAELAQRAPDLFGRSGRGGDVGQHAGRHRAVVQGTERALQAHRRLDIGFRPGGIKTGSGEGGFEEAGGVTQLLDRDSQAMQAPLVERGELAAKVLDLGVAFLQPFTAESLQPTIIGRFGLDEGLYLVREGRKAGTRQSGPSTLEVRSGKAAGDALHRRRRILHRLGEEDVKIARRAAFGRQPLGFGRDRK